MRAIVLAGLMAACGWATAEAPFVQVVTATLPSGEEFEAPDAILNMDEGVVLLDLTIGPELTPSVKQVDGTYMEMTECEYGVVDAGELSVRTGSNHILMDIRMGTPGEHAANLLACDYAPEHMTDFEPGHETRLKGCFYAHAVSIPTAIQWVLNPMPASACGFGD